MVRRSSGGGSQGRGGVRFLKNLPFHIEKCRKSYNDVEQLVDCLQANYFEYGRQKRQILKKEVQKLLESDKSGSVVSANKKMRSNLENPSTSNVVDDDDNATPFSSPVRKKMKNIGGDEGRLQLVEMQHIQRRQKAREWHCASTSSSFVSKSSDELEDGTVSTSEDAIYGEQYEPEFDLMKLMLRANYSGTKNAAKSKHAEDNEAKNLEIDVVNMKSKKLDLLREDGNGAKLKKIDTKVSSHSSGGVEVKEKDGPRFKDFGGMMEVLEELKTEVIVPIYHPQLPGTLGVRPISGILLHGPPGCGKTKLAHAIANETGIPFYKISATELVSGISGASEENIRELFSKAYRTAPSIVFIDEIDAIASKRDNLQREMEKRIVTQLMTCMDESHRIAKPADENPNSGGLDSNTGYVLVIGATNRPDAVDLALRRPGRFDREIVLGFPDETSRVEILSVITRNLKLEGAFDLMKIARSTPGFVGADLVALANKAGNLAMKRIIDQRKSELSREPVDGEQTEEWWKHRWSPEEMEKLSITMADFEEAAKNVQPSSRREGFSAIPNVKWEDVGGLDLLRQEFDRYIVRRIKYPEDYQEFGVDLETGILLYGPPGCGKTLIAKAVASEAGANFIHIKGPELLTKYVGESELAVRTIFSRARTCSPCILFFDEVDALTTRRGKEGGWVVERLLNQLLIELDGADQRRGVFVVGATNRPDVMDPAVLRSGRFGKHMYVALPSPDERGLILKALARKKPIDASVDLIGLGRHEACKNLSGADLAALMNEAAMAALEEKLTSEKSSSDGTPWTIGIAHFERALEKISPSVTDEKKYQNLAKVFNAAQE